MVGIGQFPLQGTWHSSVASAGSNVWKISCSIGFPNKLFFYLKGFFSVNVEQSHPYLLTKELHHQDKAARLFQLIHIPPLPQCRQKLSQQYLSTPLLSGKVVSADEKPLPWRKWCGTAGCRSLFISSVLQYIFFPVQVTLEGAGSFLHFLCKVPWNCNK